MITKQFEYISNMQLRIRSLENENRSYRTGEACANLRSSYEKVLREKNAEIRRLDNALLRKQRESDTMNSKWLDVYSDVQKECDTALKSAGRKVKAKDKKIAELEKEKQNLRAKISEQGKQLSEKDAKIEELEGLVRKLTAQVNMDFENSSVPSSKQGLKRKKIPNSREDTGRKRGAQKGHAFHERKKDESLVEKEFLPAPSYITGNPERYRKTKEIMKKQMISMSVQFRIIQYEAEVYRDTEKKGSKVHADFPRDCVNDVNYDGSVKAFLYELCNICNVSNDKARGFLSGLTDGNLNVSKGTVSNLIREFSEKSDPERKEILGKLMTSPVMNADFTNANVNGNTAQVLILCSPDGKNTLYIAREKKGHEGIKDTPLENYVGTVVHDHDTTFYKYGTDHQECMQHNLRYLKGSMMNEPELVWAGEMRSLIQEMLHYINGLGGEEPDVKKIEEMEAEYDRILKKAEDEYEEHPPTDYYQEGIRLSRRLKKYRTYELKFLHDLRVPSNNSVCERHARIFKRKQAQVMVFRSRDYLAYLANGMSVTDMLKEKSENVYRSVAEIFNRSLLEAELRKKEHQYKAKGAAASGDAAAEAQTA